MKMNQFGAYDFNELKTNNYLGLKMPVNFFANKSKIGKSSWSKTKQIPPGVGKSFFIFDFSTNC
jgi:hypothetical protein